MAGLSNQIARKGRRTAGRSSFDPHCRLRDRLDVVSLMALLIVYENPNGVNGGLSPWMNWDDHAERPPLTGGRSYLGPLTGAGGDVRVFGRRRG